MVVSVWFRRMDGGGEPLPMWTVPVMFRRGNCHSVDLGS